MAGGASVQTLRAFLRDERAAAARYRRALPLFTDRAETDELRACLASHERRIETLVGRIRQMGGSSRTRTRTRTGTGTGMGEGTRLGCWRRVRIGGCGVIWRGCVGWTSTRGG